MPASAQEPPARRTERILIVDDEPFMRDVLVRYLTAEGYPCSTAASAEEAWDRLLQTDYALVISDLVMPRMSGLDLLRQIRQRLPEVAVIMVTAADDRRLGIRALEEGAYGYVIKPFQRNEIVINVVNALERRRLELASRQYEQMLEETVRAQTAALRASREEIALRLMAAQQHRHGETGAHIRRLGLGAEALARLLGYSEHEAELLRLAAPMHDVGKIGIPDAILNKPDALTSEEWEVMKRHTTIGASMLEASSVPLLEMARQVALCHHERWDGSGYPKGLAGERIPEPARIVAVLDVYDALVHDRVYRPAMPESVALDIIRQERGRQFDPRVHDAFMELLPWLRRLAEGHPDRPDD